MPLRLQSFLFPSRIPFLTSSQVTKWLGVSTRTVCLWAENTQLPAVKLGRQWRFQEAQVQQWFESHDLFSGQEGSLSPNSRDARNASTRREVGGVPESTEGMEEL